MTLTSKVLPLPVVVNPCLEYPIVVNPRLEYPIVVNPFGKGNPKNLINLLLNLCFDLDHRRIQNYSEGGNQKDLVGSEEICPKDFWRIVVSENFWAEGL